MVSQNCCLLSYPHSFRGRFSTSLIRQILRWISFGAFLRSSYQLSLLPLRLKLVLRLAFYLLFYRGWGWEVWFIQMVLPPQKLSDRDPQVVVEGTASSFFVGWRHTSHPRNRPQVICKLLLVSNSIARMHFLRLYRDLGAKRYLVHPFFNCPCIPHRHTEMSFDWLRQCDLSGRTNVVGERSFCCGCLLSLLSKCQAFIIGNIAIT